MRLYLALLSASVLLFPSILLAQGPIQIPASPNTYGPDGPWNAVRAYYGSHQLDLFPGGSAFAWARNSTYCDDVTVCSYRNAGFYANSTQEHGFTSAEPFHGGYYMDSFSVSSNGPPLLYNVSIFSTDRWHDKYPNGLLVNHSCGEFDIGRATRPQSLPGRLHSMGLTQSSSVSFHLGSVKPSIPPSVWYGGYDASRVIEEPIYTYISHSSPLVATLSDISMLTLGNSRPIISNMSGLFDSGHLINESGVGVEITGAHAFLILPASVCKAITSALPVAFDSALNLYTWNTNDPLYEKLMSSPIYLAFTFEGGANPIKLPLSLLSLELEFPFPNAPVIYFPCGSGSYGEQLPTAYSLGRAFLQVATVGVNWLYGTTITPRFFIAQAPGPDFHAPDPTPIINNALEISTKFGNPSWEKSWASYWKFNFSTNGTTSRSDTGLSDGAKAGIGVGVTVGFFIILIIIGFFVWYRHRRSRQLHELPASTIQTNDDLKKDNLFELERQDFPLELYVDTTRPELDHGNQLPAELE